MNQSRIVRYIKDLDHKERDRFRLFVHSPYFNQHEQTAQLLDLILESLRKEKPSMIEKKRAFKHLFPGKPFDDQPLHNLMSYLKKLYHRFLAVEYVDGLPYQELLHTVEAAYLQHQYSLMLNRGRQLKKQLDSSEVRDANFHLTQYRLNNLTGYYHTNFVDRHDTEYLQRTLDHLDYYYLIEKIKNTCHTTANQMIFDTTHDYGLLETSLGHIEQAWDRYANEPSLVMYYHILMSMRHEEDPAHYEAMKNMLQEGLDQLSDSEGYDLFTFCQNYCIRRINLGSPDYKAELFQIYKEGLRTELLFKGGLITEWDFKNIVTLGCALKEFEWTEKFIRNHYSYLPETSRENAYSYNLANLYFNKGMYDKTLEELLHVQFTDVNYHLSTNFLLLRTYYAMEDTEALLSLIDTFRIYVIRNKKMTIERKRGYTNFLRFARKLVLIKHQSDTYARDAYHKELDQLAQKIRGSENIINKEWLLRECNLEPSPTP